MTQHSPAFEAALADVSSLLGPPVEVRRFRRWSLAEWEIDGASIALDDGEDRVVLSSSRGDDPGTSCVWEPDADGVRAALAHLGRQPAASGKCDEHGDAAR